MKHQPRSGRHTVNTLWRHKHINKPTESQKRRQQRLRNPKKEEANGLQGS